MLKQEALNIPTTEESLLQMQNSKTMTIKSFFLGMFLRQKLVYI